MSQARFHILTTWGVAPADVPFQAPVLWWHEVFQLHVGGLAACRDLVAHARVACLCPCPFPCLAFSQPRLHTAAQKLGPTSQLSPTRPFLRKQAHLVFLLLLHRAWTAYAPAQSLFEHSD